MAIQRANEQSWQQRPLPLNMLSQKLVIGANLMTARMPKKLEKFIIKKVIPVDQLIWNHYSSY